MSPSGKIDHDIDWSAPWLAPVRNIGVQIASKANWRDELNRAAQCIDLRNHRDQPLRFVEQRALPAGESYEAFISQTGQVPTRDNLHDFFNALIWLTFPRIKSRLNALQAAQIARLGIGKSRGPARDAATLFDENAALLAVADTADGAALVDALRAHHWMEVFAHRREQFNQHAAVVLFGHAIMEKLVRPYKAITAHTVVCRVDPDFHKLPETKRTAILDELVSQQLAGHELYPSLFSPLPILGVPDWWPNQDIQFYADRDVFRPARQK